MEETPLAELATADTDTMYVAYGYKGWPGYGYVFPKTAHVDAGVGFLVPFFKRELRGKPYEQHRRFLEEAARKGWVRGRSNAGELQGVSACPSAARWRGRMPTACWWPATPGASSTPTPARASTTRW